MPSVQYNILVRTLSMKAVSRLDPLDRAPGVRGHEGNGGIKERRK